MVFQGAVLLAFFSALILMSAHLFSNRIYRYSEQHRRRIISFFGGITVAYVFLDLLPRLGSTHVHLERIFGDIPAFLDAVAVPGLALVGFLIFFGLEHLAVRSRQVDRAKTGRHFTVTRASHAAFATHFVVLAFFNLIIGYVLRFEAEAGILALLLYTSALALHFVILDNSMEGHYKSLYLRSGRFIAGSMPLIGWGVSVFFAESPSVGYLLLALIYGIILFTAIKDEVPKEGGRSSGTFIVGALSYSALLLVAAWLRGG